MITNDYPERFVFPEKHKPPDVQITPKKAM